MKFINKKYKNTYIFNNVTLTYKKVNKSSLFIKDITIMSVLIIVFSLSFGIVSNYYDMHKLEKDTQTKYTQYRLLKESLNSHYSNLSDIQIRDKDIYRIYCGLEPLGEFVQQAGFGGIDRYSSFKTFKNSREYIAANSQLNILQKIAYVQSRSFDEIEKVIIRKEHSLLYTPNIPPVAINDIKRFGDGFGYRMHPILKRRILHDGVDISINIGTNIYSTADGVVSSARVSPTYGKIIEIRHKNLYITKYAHLSKINVKKGQKVKRGDIIALSGNTGRSTGPHIHYEICYSNQTAIDPSPFFDRNMLVEDFKQVVN